MVKNQYGIASVCKCGLAWQAAGIVTLLCLMLAADFARAGDIPLRPLEKSELVVRGPDGVLGVAQKDGSPIDGVKLSQHDKTIISPAVACAADGTIHVAFVETHHLAPYATAVYHRQSGDGGKTWSEAKNLSEDMPNINVGRCALLIDSTDRIYVVWRSGLAVNFPVEAGTDVNLVYRVLDHGKWSKILAVHPPGSAQAQKVGALFSFATVDAAGHVQVIWNANPNPYIPNEVMARDMPLPYIGNGLVFQATLDGTTPAAPRRIYMTKITPDPNPNGMVDLNRACDELSALDGYVDAAGTAHFIALEREVRDVGNDSVFNLIEGDKVTPAVKLPAAYMHTWRNPPKLLLDAKGRRHLIAFYEAGEHPGFRDYSLGSDDEPTIILSPRGDKVRCLGFQAYQGPGGRMAVVMQTSDTGFGQSGDSWLSMSTGEGWCTPICITNNAARASFAAKNVGKSGSVITTTHYGPGEGAVGFDRDGHLLLAICNVEVGSFGLGAGGVVYAGGSSSTPKLFFYKF